MALPDGLSLLFLCVLSSLPLSCSLLFPVLFDFRYAVLWHRKIVARYRLFSVFNGSCPNSEVVVTDRYSVL